MSKRNGTIQELEDFLINAVERWKEKTESKYNLPEPSKYDKSYYHVPEFINSNTNSTWSWDTNYFSQESYRQITFVKDQFSINDKVFELWVKKDA